MFELVAVIVIAVVEAVGIVHQNHAEKAATFSAQREENPAQSWDQANLKRNDAGCPTAIYVAPGGTLEQCP